MSEQPGILRCSICGYVGAFYIPCVCSRCMEKHHAVVDAAMALSLGDLNEIAIALDSRGDDEIAHRVRNLAEAIERAEEVKRG